MEPTAVDSLFKMANSNPLALALTVLAAFALMLIGLHWLIFARWFPRMNQTWKEEIAAERGSREKNAEADRQLHRDLMTAQLGTFKDIHEEHVRTATARHEEARGWHGEVMGGINEIKSVVKKKADGGT